MRMGLREANQQFAKAIKAVKSGTEVILTERGKPVAFTSLPRRCFRLLPRWRYPFFVTADERQAETAKGAELDVIWVG